jgi:hypothetical protein
MLVRDGVLRTRPGLVRVANSQPSHGGWGLATGATAYRTRTNQPYLVVGTTREIATFTGATWTSRTTGFLAAGTRPAFPGFLSGDLDHPSRFTQLEVGEAVYLLHTNGRDPVLEWDGITEDFVPCASDVIPGTSVVPTPVPKFTDFATIGDRIVGIIPPYEVRWGSDAALNLWAQSNFFSLAQSPDALIAIKALGTLGGVVYKTDSIWTIFAQGPTDASFYRFEHRGAYAGPASPAMVVDVDGTHLYMTRTGRVGAFTGSAHSWITDGVWPRVRETIDPTLAHRGFGVYDQTFHEVTFYFPRLVDRNTTPGLSGLCRGVLVIALPRPGIRNTMGAFPGHLAPNARAPVILGEVVGMPLSTDRAAAPLAVGAGTAYRLPDEIPRVAVFPVVSPTTVYHLGALPNEECLEDTLSPGEGSDAGEPFDFFWETGLQALPMAELHYLDAVESFLRRNPNNGAINAQVLRSYDLSMEAGERAGPWVEGLHERRVKHEQGVHVRGRFVGLRYFYEPVTARSAGGPLPPRVRWSGALVTGWPVAG